MARRAARHGESWSVRELYRNFIYLFKSADFVDASNVVPVPLRRVRGYDTVACPGIIETTIGIQTSRFAPWKPGGESPHNCLSRFPKKNAPKKEISLQGSAGTSDFLIFLAQVAIGFHTAMALRT